MSTIRRSILLGLAVAALFASGARAAGLEQINHIIVIYMENRSFDNLYGLFPGAEGLSNAGAAATQVDASGTAYSTLPPVMDTGQKPAAPDPRFPKDLPNAPFDIGKYVPIGEKTGDLVHRFWHEQEQIDGGRMDKFAAVSDAGGLVMGYYDGSGMQLWQWAKRFTLADHFFHAAFGGSFLNHFWLVCACTPKYPNAPDAMVAKLDSGGHLTKGSPDVITPDGYAVNTIQSSYQPHDAKITDAAKLLPPQDDATIGDRLSDKGISWAWYSGGWDDALAGKPSKLFQFHHQPFAYFKTYGDGTPGRAQHLKDFKDLDAAITAGDLPQVVFYKPIGDLNQHPGYAQVMAGDAHVAELLERIEKSPLWKDSAIIITSDENGGLWDHVAPPKVDRWGPGSRIPTLIVSPFARQGYVDHTVYDTTSILKLIENRFGLEPLGDRDRNAGDLTNAFAF
jgi:phospholipase C